MDDNLLKSIAPTLVITAGTIAIFEFMFRREEKKFYEELSNAKEQLKIGEEFLASVNNRLGRNRNKLEVKVTEIRREQ